MAGGEARRTPSALDSPTTRWFDTSVPRVYEWSAPVWQADVDAHGELRASALLRFLQEIATRASGDAGFDAAYYERVGGMWIVRRTTLERSSAARYGDTLAGRTWVADFRRVRSERRYDIRAGDAVVARARTDWVYVDRASGRPRRVPREIEAAFMPEMAEPLARRPLPADEPPLSAFRTMHRVEAHELDALRHVNNAAYVHYVEQSVLDACAASGWNAARQHAEGGHLRGIRYDLEYLDAALSDDVLTILTWPTAVSPTTIDWHTLVRRASTDDRPILHATSRWHWVAAASDVPLPLPGDLHDVPAANDVDVRAVGATPT